MEARSYSLGIDIGGTFTDFTLIDNATGELHVHKRPSVPASPSQAVSKGLVELLARLNESPASISTFVHGTTIGLNTILQRSGAEVTLFVSEGTRDMLEIARLTKQEKLNLKAPHEVPLVPRRRVIEVPGRIAANGEEVEELTPAMIDEALARGAGAGGTYAVCLLNAHANPAQEVALAGSVDRYAGSEVCTRSSALWPEIREYERATVAVLNAYVQPLMTRYIDELYRNTGEIGVETPLYITQSNGGIMAASTARRQPVATLLSGPASGVVGAAYIGALAGVKEAVTVDIGGTSADVSLIKGGEPAYSTEAAIGQFPLVMPSVDVFSVGAGGGSIAWMDSFGLLKVGPRSAGADPGPACYGQGGTEPTLTDAYLICGYLNPDNFLGGGMKLDRDAAWNAIATIAGKLGKPVEETAQDILDIATTTMSTALLPLMTKRGVDPRDFTLIPFGGAGATHACLLAEDIRIANILVPPSPGTICALGAAIAEIKVDQIKSLRARLDAIPFEDIRRHFSGLEEEGRAAVLNDSPAVDSIAVHRSADMRYKGQAFTIEVELPDELMNVADGRTEVERLFHDRYEQLYRNRFPDSAVELINLRVRIVGQRRQPDLRRIAHSPAGERSPRPQGEREILYRRRTWRASVHAREALLAGHVVEGPALIEQLDTTTLVAPGSIGTVDGYGLLTIRRNPARKGN